jgi:tetratricopeptide (TPR) repeat protein
MMAVLTGCAPLMSEWGTRNEQIERWVAQNQYGKAIRALDWKAKQDPATQTRLETVRSLASAYDKKLADEAQRQQKQGDWKRAFAMVDEGLANYPAGPYLQQTRKLLRDRQAQRLRELNAELLTAKAHWLLRSRAAYVEMALVDSENLGATWQAEQIRKQVEQTAASMSALGTQALSEGDLDRAERYLELADRLQFSENTTRALAQLAQLRYRKELKEFKQEQRAKAEKTKQQQREKEKQRQQEAVKLTAEMHQALQQADLPKARDALAQLNTIDHQNPDLIELEHALDQAIAAKVVELIEKGDAFYSHGQIDGAKRIWESALPLQPKNEQLRSRIDRAQRVLEKLRELKEQEAAERPLPKPQQ